MNTITSMKAPLEWRDIYPHHINPLSRVKLCGGGHKHRRPCLGERERAREGEREGERERGDFRMWSRFLYLFLFLFLVVHACFGMVIVSSLIFTYSTPQSVRAAV